MTKLLLVDDHPIVRRGLAELLLHMHEVDCVVQASNADEALEEFTQSRPDAVILDLSLGSESGLTVLNKMLDFDSSVPIMFLTMHDESLHAERVLLAGARGYVMKHEATNTLTHAVRRLLNGEMVFSPEVQNRVLTRISKHSDKSVKGGVAALTPRELEILELIGAGYTTSQIAGKLSRSVKTIETHRGSIRSKLGLSSSFELVRFALHWIEE